MSLFSALGTAVTGLRAQSFALESISDNIANAQTPGYKRGDTSFEDIVASTALSQQLGGTVSSSSRTVASLAGASSNTGVATNIALNGSGFITVRQPTGLAGVERVFPETNFYTRRGDFSLDKDGYLVNGAGYFLVGSRLDPVTGGTVGAAPDVLRITGQFIPAQRTSQIVYSANLPATPKTTSWDATVPGSDLWAAGAAAPPTVGPADTPGSASLVTHSVSGGSVRVYDSVGRAVDVDVRWAKLNETAAGSTWAMYVNSTTAATAGDQTWKLATTVTFDTSGRATAPTAAVALDLPERGLSPIKLDVSGNNLRQNDDRTGQAAVFSIRQDGYATGSFTGISIADDGRVYAQFTNGRTQPLAQIAVAQFNAPDMLRRQDGSAFQETVESGAALFRSDGTTVNSGQVEGSNADLADEFSKLIVTQQAYSANTRVLSTTQDMMQQLLQVVR